MSLLRSRCLKILLLLSMAAGPAAEASDAEEISALLHAFLAGASIASVDAHNRFWAEDLVYTSSSGTRTDKAEIMKSVHAAADSNGSEPDVVYSAEDVDVRLYENTAIVAFRLLGTPKDESATVMQYFNTGTFVKREDIWSVVAWQATRIPEIDSD